MRYLVTLMHLHGKTHHEDQTWGGMGSEVEYFFIVFGMFWIQSYLVLIETFVFNCMQTLNSLYGKRIGTIKGKTFSFL